MPAYRTVTREQASARWLNGVPEHEKAALIPPGVFDAWVKATWATDAEGAQQDPPVIRAPNGVMADVAATWWVGKPYYDPAKIAVPVLLVTAAWDSDVPPTDRRRTTEPRGTDTGPNPVELVLAALGTCQEITYRAYATALGIPLESVSVKLEGSLDLRGFFAVKDGVRAGFNEVRGVVELKSSAPAADLAKLKEVVDAHCPVLDILRAPVPVDLKLKTERAVQAA